MSLYPSGWARPGEVWISPWSFQSIGVPFMKGVIASALDSNWIAANVVIYVPFVIPEAAVARKMAWSNGSAVAGNVDVGIYDSAGNRLVSSGSTAQAVIGAVQVVDITDTLLSRGQYYMAMVSDTSGVTQKFNAAAPLAPLAASWGLLEQAAVTLPLATNANPATFAKYTRAFIPLFGIQLYRTIGP